MEQVLVDKVSLLARHADSIAWDTCHKIYLLMDKTQTQQMRDYEYDTIITKEDGVDFMETIKKWFDDSCSLRFVDAVYTKDGADEFISVVSQFEGDPEEDEEEDY